MSDTRNHTTRDQLAEKREFVRGLILANFNSGRYGYRLDAGKAADDVLDFLAPVVEEVRAAVVAETTAAIEAVHHKGYNSDRDETWGANPVCEGCEQSWPCETIRALSGGRTALDTAKAAAWDEALEAVANERGSFGMQTRNPYRAYTGADQ